jgi:hypothetical protein
MGKCTNCLRGARFDITGVAPSNTLKMDMGGAVLYVMPKPNGEIDIVLNTENLLDGDYACAYWDGNEWMINTGDDRNTPKRRKRNV